ncbi:DUF6542 domain-containing protein [Motilibacter deserti]|uniref:DUF6542 domain-containing protein n=1 Tax=Motilibacter deserti TaxID=2714956 RepID=A0ABX0H0R1_9ACTN|nr:DUF6542 domain-containing protein [Motilibacter deserti]NHC15496.1 hypothetical protein [Motilibacter deserti]
MHNPVRAKAPSELEATGVALLGAAAAFTGALVDIAIGQKLGLAFLATFLVASVWGAARVRRSELVAAVVLPPLVFAVVAFLAGQFLGRSADGGWLMAQGLDLVSALATGAPALVAGTVLAGAVAGGRLVLERRAAAADGVDAEEGFFGEEDAAGVGDGFGARDVKDGREQAGHGDAEHVHDDQGADGHGSAGTSLDPATVEGDEHADRRGHDGRTDDENRRSGVDDAPAVGSDAAARERTGGADGAGDGLASHTTEDTDAEAGADADVTPRIASSA